MDKLFVVFLISAPLLLASCTKKSDLPKQNVIFSQDQLIEKGKKVYQMNCLSCHGPTPKLEGPIGPSIAGSSHELITLRVMKTQYPQGYKPKRVSALMPALPHLEGDIPAIYEYLNSIK